MGSKELTKVYEPRQAEAKWYQYWLEQDFFHAADSSPRKPFSIVIPPPNVTGMLHMGHALNNVLQDIVVRYKRMQGYNALWMPGMDHAGIATQNVVEQELAKEGLTRHDLGREKFIERVWEWKAKYGGVIIHQLKRLGCSCDWARERFTMDEGLSKAVREVFVRLYNDGLIYQGDYIVNWCPRCRTAISDLEVEYHPEAGQLWSIRYPFAEGEGGIVVATTRPETMLGDTAVAVNPEDERYRGVVGKEVILPLVNRKIPIIADDYVTKEFGSGAVKITPSSDPNDFAMAGRHNLPIIRIMDDNAVITEHGGAYEGQDRYECRRNVLRDLEAQGCLVGTEPYTHNIGRCYRCKTDIEPAVSRQWFVKIAPLAKEAIAAVVMGKTRIIPSSWDATYFEWMNNIRDWCISRQIWWGHRIPVWTCEGCGKVIVASDDPASCPACGAAKLRQEEDVLDTWFSSALWPFSTLGWPENTEALKTFYPTSLLVTGFDILFFWVARMMMMGLYVMKDVPFQRRLPPCPRPGRARREDEQVEGEQHRPARDDGQVRDGRLPVHAGRLHRPGARRPDVGGTDRRVQVFHQQDLERDPVLDDEPRGFLRRGARSGGRMSRLADRWILSRLNRTVAEVIRGLDEYRFNDASAAVYQFVWHEFCDWYLELAKPVLYGEKNAAARRAAQKTLRTVLTQSLKLLHPFMPFLTEEIWQTLVADGSSVMVSPFPETDECPERSRGGAGDGNRDGGDHPDQEHPRRDECGPLAEAPGDPRGARCRPASDAGAGAGLDHESGQPGGAHDHRRNGRTEGSGHGGCRSGPGLRLSRRGDRCRRGEGSAWRRRSPRIEKDLAVVSRKLANPDFLAKAAEAVVTKEREKARGFGEKRAALEAALQRLATLAAEG